MRRRLALRAEVVRRRHEAPAEVVLPDAVDHHAGRQRVASGRSASSASCSRPLPFSSAGSAWPPRTCRNRARHLVAELRRVALELDPARRRPGVALGDGVGRRRTAAAPSPARRARLAAPCSSAFAARPSRLRPSSASSHRRVAPASRSRVAAPPSAPYGSQLAPRPLGGGPAARGRCWLLVQLDARPRVARAAGRCRRGRSSPRCGIGSNLWSWQRAQLTRQPEERPAEVVDRVLDRSGATGSVRPRRSRTGGRWRGSRWR